jgi:hypothetical protein
MAHLEKADEEQHMAGVDNGGSQRAEKEKISEAGKKLVRRRARRGGKHRGQNMAPHVGNDG